MNFSWTAHYRIDAWPPHWEMSTVRAHLIGNLKDSTCRSLRGIYARLSWWAWREEDDSWWARLLPDLQSVVYMSLKSIGTRGGHPRLDSHLLNLWALGLLVKLCLITDLRHQWPEAKTECWAQESWQAQWPSPARLLTDHTHGILGDCSEWEIWKESWSVSPITMG